MSNREPPIPYWLVDAFAAQPFSGNPAAVVKLKRWLPDAKLQSIAAEFNQPACAFLVACEEGELDWEICWFSPTAQIMLCGHASIASGFVTLSESGGERVIFKTRHCGVIEVARAGAGYRLALPSIETEPQSAISLSGQAQEIRRSKDGRTLILLEDEAAIREIGREVSLTEELAGDQVIVTAPGENSDIVSRVFYDGREDAVTGSAHAALAPFWAQRLGRTRLSAHQASSRSGDLLLELEEKRVWISGECRLFGKGEFYLTG